MWSFRSLTPPYPRSQSSQSHTLCQPCSICQSERYHYVLVEEFNLLIWLTNKKHFKRSERKGKLYVWGSNWCGDKMGCVRNLSQMCFLRVSFNMYIRRDDNSRLMWPTHPGKKFFFAINFVNLTASLNLERWKELNSILQSEGKTENISLRKFIKSKRTA